MEWTLRRFSMFSLFCKISPTSACLLCLSFRQLTIPQQRGKPKAWGSEERRQQERGVLSPSLVKVHFRWVWLSSFTTTSQVYIQCNFFWKGIGKKGRKWQDRTQGLVGINACAHLFCFHAPVLWHLLLGSSDTIVTKPPVLPDVCPELGLHLALTLELAHNFLLVSAYSKIIM